MTRFWRLKQLQNRREEAISPVTRSFKGISSFWCIKPKVGMDIAKKESARGEPPERGSSNHSPASKENAT
jgi:hypothetical protein